MITGHGGNIYQLSRELGCHPLDIVDMSSNVNPFGPPPGLLPFLSRNLDLITALPEADARAIVEAFARSLGSDPARILAGNGTTQFIYTLPRALAWQRALIAGPTYADYADACRMHGTEPRFVLSREEDDFAPDLAKIAAQLPEVDACVICNPNNPTGRMIPARELEAFCRDHARTLFVVDESYLPFAPDGEADSLIPAALPNVIVLHSLSKIFRVPGLRIGFVIAAEGVIEKLARFYLPWSAGSLAQAAVRFVLENEAEVAAFTRETRRRLTRLREEFAQALAGARYFRLFPSATSFVLARLGGHLTAGGVFARLARERILIRNCANFKGLGDGFIRVSLKTAEANQRLAGVLLRLEREED